MLLLIVHIFSLELLQSWSTPRLACHLGEPSSATSVNTELISEVKSTPLVGECAGCFVAQSPLLLIYCIMPLGFTKASCCLI